MGSLTEPAFNALVAADCAACGGRDRVFQAFLDVRLPLLEGDVVGNAVFVHDGEKFIDGVFAVACAACKQVAFTSDVCPRCNANGGLALALSASNRLSVPAACPSCDGEEVRFIALTVAKVGYMAGRAEKPRTSRELGDDGFHGLRVDCAVCGTVAEATPDCPLCGAQGPLRPRP